MPKLLDIVKESGLSHEEVADLIKNRTVETPIESEIIEQPEVGVEVEETPTSEVVEEEVIEEEVVDEDVEALVQKLADEEEAKIELKEKADKAKIALMVQEELKKRGKITRKTPSKGTVTTDRTIDYGISGPVNGYEVKTIRKAV